METMHDERTPVSALPVGVVTFVLTDIEGSTAQWEAEPDEMAAAVKRHYELLDEVVGSHGGVRPLEQGEGDSTVAVFARAQDAVAAALDAQRVLTIEAWPTSTPLKVRVAVHAGEARLRDELNYIGSTIIRTARLRAIAHGGQVLLSSAARDLAVDDLGADVDLLDVGTHRLKDLTRPEHVWQLAHPDLEAEFPSLRSLDAVPNNLPVSLSSFIGRFEEIETIARLIYDNRLVTLTGAGGAGKTRLAQQVAAEVTEAFPDGVWWIDLASVSDRSLVASAVSRALLLPEDRGDRVGGVVRRLAAKRALLVLDNCEHLLDACAEVAAAVLTGCRDVAVLTTSRAPLNLPGELSWRLPPFSENDAIRLFADRATKVRQDFRLTNETTSDVVAICERLDGIPLAIELAAARCRVLTPGQILDGLADAMGLLASPARGVLPHHQTIDASIRWSHSLLSGTEQVLFRRLGVFEAPFSLEAASAVVPGDALPVTAVLPGLETLVDQSLVQMDDQRGVARFRMLDTVRQFASREVEEAGERDALSARHAAHFVERARSLWPLFNSGMSELLDQADLEYEDLTAMYAHLEANASPEEHAAIAMAGLPAIGVRHTAEASLLADRVVARVEDMTVPGGRLRTRMAVVDPMNPEHVGMCLAAAEATGDPELLAYAAYWQLWGACAADPTPGAVAEFVAAREKLGEFGETHFIKTYWTVAAIERSVGRHTAATRSAELAKTETQCKRCNVMVWSEAALLALAFGDLQTADAAIDRALGFAAEVRDAGFAAHVRVAQTEAAVYAGRPWPAAEIEAELTTSGATGSPLVLGYLREARATGQLVDGTIDDDAGFVAGIELIDNQFSKRTEARLRRMALHHARGDLDGAAEFVAELRAAAEHWEAGPWLLSQVDHRSGALALDNDDAVAADDLAHESLSAAFVGPWPPLVVASLELLSSVAVARESFVEAARLAGAAARVRDEIGFRLDIEPERGRLARDIAVARAAMGDADHARSVEEGRGLTLPEAVAYARRARGERKRPSHGWDGLTPTERQVADLALEGMSNAQIADRLFIGRETVKTHLSNVYAKVGVANRTQLVAHAAKRGITS
jgi:predicted ATPase/class 3 adenylate cyclase/DNA-binding CsgD family transcriptional regulator